MSIYLELIERVSDGEPFHVDFEKRNMKIGRSYLIKDGKFDEARKLLYCSDLHEFQDLSGVLCEVEQLYKRYKYSLPSERSDNKRKRYFKALPMEEITDEQLIVAERREVACAKLEGFVLCMILSGQLVWDEEIMEGKWFWQSKIDSDLVLLKSWIEGK